MSIVYLEFAYVIDERIITKQITFLTRMIKTKKVNETPERLRKNIT